jgi:hypothetical protein
MKVIKIDRNTAKPFIEKYHYTKSIGKVSLAFGLYNEEKMEKIGLFDRAKLVGVITYGQVSSRDLAQSIFEGGTQYNCWEFLRMAVVDEEEYPRTQFISKTIKYIKANNPEIKCLVSFADQTEGHFGYVYQASNWLYCGTTGKKYHFIVDGKRVNKRMAYDKGKLEGLKEREFVDKYKWKKIIELPKFRYIYPLQEIKLKLKTLKYPKKNIN